MVPSQGGRAQLCGRLIVFRSDDFQLWSELPALAPGARCRLGRSVGSGAPRAMQWTAIRPGTSVDPSRVLEQGPDRQRAPTGCSGGVSSINGASESRCSHDGSGSRGRQGQNLKRHRSSREAMALHERGFTVQGQAPLAVLAGAPGPAGCVAPAAPVSAHRQSRSWRCSGQRA